MGNQVLRTVGNDIMFADGNLSPSTNNVLSSSYTRYALALSGNVTDGSSRQSDKADFTAQRAPAYSVTACLEFGDTPTDGDSVEFYWAPSRSTTAAVGNTGNTTGSDAAYTGWVDDDGGVAQLQMIGTMICENQSGVQIAYVGTFSPPERYGCLVVKNESGQHLRDDDATEHQVVFSPIIDEVI